MLAGLIGLITFPCGPQSRLQAQSGSVVVMNAASYAADALAPNAMAAAFGSFVTTGGQSFSVTTTPLPTTLGGVRITVGGINCGLIAVTPGQINLVIPAGVPEGANQMVVTNSDGTTRSTTLNVQRFSPGIFTARSSGVGAAAALVTQDGMNYQLTYNIADSSEREVGVGTVARPNFLVLYGTGLRNATADTVSATIQGVPAKVVYAGLAGGSDPTVGLDQLNLIIPPALSGQGIVRVRLNVAGRPSNIVTILIGGPPPAIRAEPLTAGATVFGVLSSDDQVQGSGDGTSRTYFFDAYRLTTTAPNTTVAIDLRSVQFNAQTAIAQLRTDGTINFLASDDQTGGAGNGRIENDNALLLAVLREAGEYIVFVTSSDSDPNATGGYILTARTGALQAASYGATPISATIGDADILTSAGTRLDGYWFAATAGDVVQIRMASTAFDSFLLLNAENGDLLELDDNSGGGAQGRDALVTRSITRSGNYIIIATPFEPGRSGAYTLALNRLNTTNTDGSFPLAVARRAMVSPRETVERGLGREQFDQFASRHFLVTTGSRQ